MYPNTFVQGTGQGYVSINLLKTGLSHVHNELCKWYNNGPNIPVHYFSQRFSLANF